jgi:hypothetical protein
MKLQNEPEKRFNFFALKSSSVEDQGLAQDDGRRGPMPGSASS